MFVRVESFVFMSLATRSESIGSLRGQSPKMVRLTETATRLLLEGPENELKALSIQLRFRPPAYWHSDAYQLYKKTDGEMGWDGYSYPLKVRWIKESGSYRGECMRGIRPEVESAADMGGIELSLELLHRPFQGIEAEDVPSNIIEASFELDPSQRECIANWLREGNGINHMAVNSGKTACFSAVAAMIRQRHPEGRILYCTQSERLVRQAHREICSFLPDWDISQFGGGKKERDGKHMVVATNAMIGRNMAELHAKRWFKSFIAVLCDECHHVSSPTCQKFLRLIPAFYRLGASDTMLEDDLVRKHLIRGMLGPRLDHVVSSKELVESGRSARPHIYVIDNRAWEARHCTLTHKAEEGSVAWCIIDGRWERATYIGPVYEDDPEADDGIRRTRKGDPVVRPNLHLMLIERTSKELEVQSRWCLLNRLHDQAIIRFSERNKLIVDWAEHFSRKGWPTLVIATRTIHILILQALLKDRIGADKVQVLYGGHDSAERDEAFAWIQASNGGVLITPLAKEGVNLPAIRAGVIADHVVSWEVAKQMIGRFVRKKVDGENEAHLALFLDRQHPSYRRSSILLLRRLETIQGYSYHYPVIGPEMIEQAQEFSRG